mmetsp:Transcript_132339/g.423442  ORF Transcript_132339/g.423442 Transcript_132339/m.423442 type:complete len:202 (+) Transcript_132339:1482-2087(+)
MSMQIQIAFTTITTSVVFWKRGDSSRAPAQLVWFLYFPRSMLLLVVNTLSFTAEAIDSAISAEVGVGVVAAATAAPAPSEALLAPLPGSPGPGDSPWGVFGTMASTGAVPALLPFEEASNPSSEAPSQPPVRLSCVGPPLAPRNPCPRRQKQHFSIRCLFHEVALHRAAYRCSGTWSGSLPRSPMVGRGVHHRAGARGRPA